MANNSLIRRPMLQLLPPHEQLESLQEDEDSSPWVGQTLLVILENGYQFMGTVIKVNETHIVTTCGTAKKDKISYVRIMGAEEISIRRGLDR